MDLNPDQTTLGDLITSALKECGAIGKGQSPTAEDMNDAWVRWQWMMEEWERKRWLVYHNVTIVVQSTGAMTYTVGPGGNFNTDFSGDFSRSADVVIANRPNRLEAAFRRQYGVNGSLNIDTPLTLLQSMEDYSRIGLKGMSSLPEAIFYDPAWPQGILYPWPIPQANLYGIGIVIREQLPVKVLKLNTVINLPYEYFSAINYNLALRLRGKYGIPAPPPQIDDLMRQAKSSLATLRGANIAIAELVVPAGVSRGGLYNIFSDSKY